MDDYCEARSISFTEEQFLYLLKIFPSLLVCMSDGILDKEEWAGLLTSICNLSKKCDVIDQDTVIQLNKECLYLFSHLKLWEDRFLSVLKQGLTYKDKETVFIWMHFFANAHNGISSIEQIIIDRIADQLKFEMHKSNY